MLKSIFVPPCSRTLIRGKFLSTKGALAVANRPADRNGRPRYTTAASGGGGGGDDASFDVVIVGGGIVGLAAAQELSYRYPGETPSAGNDVWIT